MDITKLKLKGNSLYGLEVRNSNNPMVVKYSYDYDERLLKSAYKQATFKSNYFKTPPITFIDESKKKSSFEMKFIQGNSFVEFFLNASKSDLDSLINKLKDTLMKELRRREYFK